MPHPPARYIEPISLLGTTWYERGWGYWLRRVGLSLAYLLFTAVCGVLTGLIVHAFWIEPDAPPALKWVLTLIIAVIVLISATVTARAFNREYAGINQRRDNKTSRRLLATSVGLVGLARLITIGVLALALCAFIGFGAAAMRFVYSLRPEFFGEHQARLRHEKTHREAVAG
jgi:cation transporter-like permease